MTHLILHKVRGEPAFDVAEKLQIGDEEGWIIPTSGHRAYPHMTWPLDQLWFNRDYVPIAANIPTDWPDHYQCDSGEAPKPNFNIMAIISPMMTKFKRRL